MKEILKNHWPAAITIAISIICIVQFLIMPGDEDPIGLILTYLYILIPLCALVTSIWYGYRIPGIWKWGIVIAFGLLEMVLVIIGSGMWDIDIFAMAPLAALPSFVGMMLGWAIRRIRNR